MNWLGFEFRKNTSTEHEDESRFLKGFFVPPETALVGDGDISQSHVSRLLQRVDVPALETALGYKFRERTFLLEALTHCSYSVNKITNSYERLEFLGKLSVKK